MSTDTTETTGIEDGAEATSFKEEAIKPVEAGPPPAQDSFDLPRPWLTLQQAAAALGKSVRALERSLLGRWGNRLPEGWTARKLPSMSGQDWRIMPPPGFRFRQNSSASSGEGISDGSLSPSDYLKISDSRRKQIALRHDDQSFENATIVIDRSDEIEYLLKELVQTQKQLMEERRLRVEDFRMISQMSSSMRLLEDKASDTAKLKDGLVTAKNEFQELKKQYLEEVSKPWWKKIFKN